MPVIEASGGSISQGFGPFRSAGIPAAGYLNGVALKGALCIDETNGTLYQNTGTITATIWTAR